MAKQKHIFRNLLIASCGALGGLHLLNRAVIRGAVKVRRLAQEHGSFYCWKYGRIYYKKEGTGRLPLLLIHDASEFSCGYEWRGISKELRDDFTIYTVDLPGCGRSDKPAVTYTNYFYVMAVRDFMHDVIGKPAWIAASGLSSSFAVMAGAFDQKQILGLVMLNPNSLQSLTAQPDKPSAARRTLLTLPIIGTGLYHVITSRTNLENLLGRKYFHNPLKLDLYTLQTFHESAHLQNSSGRFLSASLKGGFLNWDIRKALSKASYPVCILYGESLNNAQRIAQSYKKYCRHASVQGIVDTRMFPHMENPEYTASLMRKFICS